MTKWACLTILFTVHWSRTIAQSYANYTSLYTYVLQGYNPNVLPLDNHSDSLHIYVNGYLYSLLDVDVVLGKVTITFAIDATWTDSQIRWTPSEYGNLSMINIPRKEVWSPNILLGTPTEFSVMGEPWMPVSFTSNGKAWMAIVNVLSSVCSFNMEFWPFDTQVCEVSFAIYGYTMSQVRLHLLSTNTLNQVSDNIEWDIRSASMYERLSYGFPEIVLRLEIERRSSIFVILIIFPLYGIGCLTPFTFLLPSDSGERIGFSTTILLSLTVFLDVISEYIPNASKPLPLLCIVVTVGVSVSLACTLAVILSLYLYHKDEDIPVQGIAVIFVKLFNQKFRKSKIETECIANDENLMNTYVTPTRSNLKQMTSADICYVKEAKNNTETNTTISGELKSATSGDPRKSASGDLDISWKDVSYTVDKVCFTGGILVQVLVMFGFTLRMVLG